MSEHAFAGGERAWVCTAGLGKLYEVVGPVPVCAGGPLQGEFYTGDQTAFLTPHSVGHGVQVVSWHAGLGGDMYPVPPAVRNEYAPSVGTLASQTLHPSTYMVRSYEPAQEELAELVKGIKQLEDRISVLESRKAGRPVPVLDSAGDVGPVVAKDSAVQPAVAPAGSRWSLQIARRATGSGWSLKIQQGSSLSRGSRDISERLAALNAGIVACEARLAAIQNNSSGAAEEPASLPIGIPGAFFPPEMHWLRLGNMQGSLRQDICSASKDTMVDTIPLSAKDAHPVQSSSLSGTSAPVSPAEGRQTEKDTREDLPPKQSKQTQQRATSKESISQLFSYTADFKWCPSPVSLPVGTMTTPSNLGCG